MQLEVINHKIYGDSRGNLVVLESIKDVPFDIKRVFYIYGTAKNLSRGNHAHNKTEQYLIAVAGSCSVTLSDGKKSTSYVLDAPNKGVYQGKMVWGTMHDFSDDCVLLVLASHPYDDSDYICEYGEFLKLIGE